MSTSQPQVFISYQRTDGEFARRMREHLVAHGVKTWMDQYDIPVGAYWPDEIDKGLASSDIVIGILSPDAVDSRNVKNEWDWALSHNKPLLLVLARPTPDVPHRYVSLNFIDATADQPDAFAALLQSLGVEMGEQLETLTSISPTPVRHSARRAARLYPNAPAVIGREREQALLTGKLDELFDGRGGLLLVSGEAGIGKTTLTSSLGWAAEERGALVLAGGCFDLSTTPPYGPWNQIIRAWPADSRFPEVPEAMRGGEALAKVGSQRALFDLVADFIAGAGRVQPLVLLLEDLHWADQASLDLLRYVARLVQGFRVLLVVTYRDDEITRRHPLFALLPALAREPGAERIGLQRLDSDGVSELVARRYSLPEGEHARLASYVQRVAEGNPFFVGEVLRALEEAGVLCRDGEAWDVGNLDAVHVPALVRQVIETRLARLGEAAQELLQAAAVIGHEAPVELWMEVSGADEALLAETLEQAVEARLVEELRGGERFRFTHALIRETLYEGLVSIRRRSWHRRIAEALERAPRPDPDLVAHHYVQLNDPRAVEWLVRAADRAEMSYARMIAVERLEIAGQLLEEDVSRTAERGWLLLRVATLARIFDPRKGVSYTVDVERIGEQIGDQLLRAMAISIRATALSYLGEFERSLATMRDVGPIMERLTPDDLERLFRLTRTLTFDESATVRGDEIERIVTELDVKRWINAIVLTMFLARSGRLDEALSIGERQVAAYERIAPGLTSNCNCHYLAAEPRGGMGYAYAALGQPDDARRVLAESLRALQFTEERYVLYQRFGLALHHVVMPYVTDDLPERERLVAALQGARASAAGSIRGAGIPFLGQHYILLGAWDQAWADAEAALSSTSHGWDLMIARLTLGQIALLRGLRSTPDWLAPLVPDGTTTDPGRTLLLEGLHAQLLLATEVLGRSDVIAARGWLEAHDRWLDQTGAVLGRADGLIVWSRYHQQLGDVRQAESRGREAIEQASTPRQPLALLAAQRQIGAVLTVTGDHDAAHQHLRGALALAEACAGPFERALTLIALAELRLATGDHEAARTLLAESYAICEPLQARPTLERITALEAQIVDAVKLMRSQTG